jgi:hypothetical protein
LIIEESAPVKAQRNRVSIVAFGLVALLCLTGSSRAFIVKPEGSLSAAISFRFYLSPNDKPLRLNIVEFVVQERQGEMEWNTAWELKGKQSLEAIIYGARYESLTEVTSAKPLSRGMKYRALVTEQSWMSPRGYSATYFVLDERGAIAVSEPK